MAEERNEESAVVTLLRRNDPSVSEIKIVMSQFEGRNLQELVGALEQNDYVTCLKLFFGGVDVGNAQWSHFLRLLAARVNLKGILLQDFEQPSQRVPTFLLSFLHAIQHKIDRLSSSFSGSCGFPVTIFYLFWTQHPLWPNCLSFPARWSLLVEAWEPLQQHCSGIPTYKLSR
jgi:hypothetical protein